jgi:hypothetical protein
MLKLKDLSSFSRVPKNPFSRCNQGYTTLGPHPGFNTGFTPRILYIKRVGEPRVKPGVWCPDIWALDTILVTGNKETAFD